MQQSLESHAFLLKGFILTVSLPPVPPGVMQSLDAIIEGLQRHAATAHAPVDVTMAAYSDVMSGRAAPLAGEDKQTGRPAARATIDHIVDTDEMVGFPKPRRAAVSIPASESPKDAAREAAAAAPPKKRARHTLLTLDNLADVQKRHDQQESNGSIAADYDVSDQTIINFLKAHGEYHSRPGARPRPRMEMTPLHPLHPKKPEPPPAPLYSKREDMLGDPMPGGTAPVSTARAAKRSYAWKNGRFGGILLPGDLMDIHDMLAAGKTCADIAEGYKVERQLIEAFILANQSAQMMRVKHTPPQPFTNAAKPPDDKRKRKRKWQLQSG